MQHVPLSIHLIEKWTCAMVMLYVANAAGNVTGIAWNCWSAQAAKSNFTATEYTKRRIGEGDSLITRCFVRIWNDGEGWRKGSQQETIVSPSWMTFSIRLRVSIQTTMVTAVQEKLIVRVMNMSQSNGEIDWRGLDCLWKQFLFLHSYLPVTLTSKTVSCLHPSYPMQLAPQFLIPAYV